MVEVHFVVFVLADHETSTFPVLHQKVSFKSQANETRFFLFYHNRFCSRIIEIPHWRLAWKYSHSHFLAKSTLRVLGKRINIVFALHKCHRQREFALWRVFKQIAREFEAR